jgi:hypothetical protein
MIIGRYCVDPSDVLSGSVIFDSDTAYYRVVIKCIDAPEYAQSVLKQADADLLTRPLRKGRGYERLN